MKYEVEAIQWDGSDEAAEALESVGAFFKEGKKGATFIWSTHPVHVNESVWIPFTVGDWIVRHSSGEFTAVPDAVFHHYYKSSAREEVQG